MREHALLTVFVTELKFQFAAAEMSDNEVHPMKTTCERTVTCIKQLAGLARAG